MIITPPPPPPPCVKRSNVLLRSFQSTLHKIICKSYSFMTSLLLPYSKNTVPFPVESLLLWHHFFVLMMSSDIHKNPGPMGDPNKNYNSGFLSFGNWNLNTLSKDEFHRISLLEANNTLFTYDIISLCETSLNDSLKVPENILNGYIYISWM